MWRQTTLSVAGNQQEALLDAVRSYFESDRRYGNIEWLEPGRVLAASAKYNFSTGGEGVKVEVTRGAGEATTDVAILSASMPIYDWGKNQRNIDALINHLRSAGFVVDVKATCGKHKIGGQN